MKPGNTNKVITFLWWNVNRRLDAILKNESPIEYKPHVIFLLETSMGYESIPEMADYAKYADKNIL